MFGRCASDGWRFRRRTRELEITKESSCSVRNTSAPGRGQAGVGSNCKDYIVSNKIDVIRSEWNVKSVDP